jgi:hypothetical protein
VARKGAYALREALRGLDLPVVLLGSELEGADFWSGIETLRPGDGTIPRDWMAAVAAIVQPALVEERPRHLLSAYAAGLPIIASAACGLPAGPAVTIIPALDTGALRQALVQLRERIG